jgi:hypothetical protein
MANLTGANIGLNTDGILNLGATLNETLTTTPKIVTDGAGNNSALLLSTERAVINAPAGFLGRILDLQINGVTVFNVDSNAATVTTSYNIQAGVFLGNTAALSGGGGVKVGDSRIRSGADGVLLLLNDAANNFDLLQFGGVTSNEPALRKQGSATLQAYKADGSGFGFIQGKLQTDNAYVAALVVPTGYILIYDSAGTPYKVAVEL